MKRNLAIFFFSILSAGVVSALGQSGGQDFSYTVSTAQAWTDTQLDLQTGDVLQISASGAGSAVPDRHAVSGSGCDPQGVSGGSTAGLPLASAPAGALIARLHAQGVAPLLIGSGTELRIEEPSHLFLGVNSSGTPPCQGSFMVKVHKLGAAEAATATNAVPSPGSALASSASTPASSTSANAASSSASTESKTRGEQLKSQLATAAQVFMQGQFGMSKSESGANGGSNATSAGSGETATAAPALKVSDAPLDAELRKSVDGLPRRVNDQFQNLGDMVNFVIVGSQKDVQAALDAATWHVADVGNTKAALNAVLETYEKKDYLQMPMSTLFLFGRAQDYG